MSLHDWDFYFKWLGRDVLREGYRLGRYRKSVLDGIFDLSNGRDLVDLLVAINPSLPCPYTLKRLTTKWPAIRQDCMDLINAEETNPTNDGKKTIQEIFRFWLRCLKAHMLIKNRIERRFRLLKHETVLLLREILENGAPDFTLNGYISILQKMVEIALYDTWTFAIWPRQAPYQRCFPIGNLVKSTEAIVRERSRQPNNEFFQSDHLARMYTYTVVRAVYGLFPQEKRWGLSMDIPADALVQTLMPTKSLLFRALCTLLKLEWKARTLRLQYDYIPSYWVFANLLEAYEFNLEELANDLIPYETDGLQYIIGFMARVLVTRKPSEMNDSEELTYHLHPDFISSYGPETRQLFLLLASKLEAAFVALGIGQEDYPVVIHNLRLAAARLH
nr:expressed protein [Hymenolepis microstoma]